MPIGAGISAVGSLGSAAIGAFGASSAAKDQEQAQQAVLKAITGTISPIISQGQGIVSSAQPTLTNLLTPGNMTSTLSQLPGFQFAQDWGQKAVQNLGTTTGLGGNVLTAGANYATGLAQQGYSGLVQNLQNFLNSGLQTETNAASTLAAGQQSALTGIGNAQASGALGVANAASGGIGGLGSAALLYGLGNKLGVGGTGGASIYSSGSLFPSASFLNPSTPFNPAGG
jgi:hypothetical protein